MSDISIQIEWLKAVDLPKVLSIEADSFTHPWAEKEFREHLNRKSCIGMVAKYKRKVVGFMVYYLHDDRIDLLNIAVDPVFRGRSIGSQMIEKIRTKLSSGHRHSLTLNVRESNLPAQVFFRGHLFRAEAILRNHFCNDEGAITMRYSVLGAMLKT